MRVTVGVLCLLTTFYHFASAVKGPHEANVARAESNSSGVLVDFQVAKPVVFDPPSSKCNEIILLMQHQFAFSYGQPFVGNFVPPSCDFDTVRINLTVTSAGRQYDRLALMFLGDIEVFRTSTAEPTANGIIWTYIKEMSQYLSLWKQPQTVIFDLGNLVNNIYTGSYNATLTASFTYENNVKVADLILPISANQAANNQSSAFQVPPSNATAALTVPKTASRAVVSISACGQIDEEFWWSDVLNDDIWDFNSTIGELYGYSPWREIQLYIDGLLAGVIWPFPVIFTGGVVPGFWRPIVGIDAFDLREPEIDVSPFLPLLTDGNAHTFDIKVAGLNTPPDSQPTVTESVGSYWVITGKLFIYEGNGPANAAKSLPPTIHAPEPVFSASRNLVTNPHTGVNESLSYTVKAERTLTITSGGYSWTQSLTYSNTGYLNQDGLSQRNIQNTNGFSTAVGPSIDGESGTYHTSFSYPLDVNTTYAISDTYFNISGIMSRGLDISSSGGLGVSTYTLVSGPANLQTSQQGVATYESINGGSSYSTGETSQPFLETADGSTYSTFVKAVNGSVVEGGSGDESSYSPTGWHLALGRPNVRSMLGRGPSGWKQ